MAALVGGDALNEPLGDGVPMQTGDHRLEEMEPAGLLDVASRGELREGSLVTLPLALEVGHELEHRRAARVGRDGRAQFQRPVGEHHHVSSLVGVVTGEAQRRPWGSGRVTGRDRESFHPAHLVPADPIEHCGQKPPSSGAAARARRSREGMASIR